MEVKNKHRKYLEVEIEGDIFVRFFEDSKQYELQGERLIIDVLYGGVRFEWLIGLKIAEAIQAIEADRKQLTTKK